MTNFEENRGLLEDIEQRLKQLMEESKDPEYTEYLKKMTERLRYQKYQTDLLKDELDRSYRMYQDRIAKAEAPKQTVEEPPKPVNPAPQKKKNTEFTIGAAVLSVVGGGFILAALVTLGMTFMEGIFKGLCLYAIALVFLLISELLIYRRWPMLGAALTSIGIGGLYLSTAVNYIGLHNFNSWVTLGLVLAITLLVILFSRKRDSVLYRLIGLISGYLCFFTIREGITDTEFFVVTGMILLLNALSILLPVRKHKTIINITHMAVNTFFAVCFVLRARLACDVMEWPVWIFVISSMVVMLMLFVSQFNFVKKENCGKEQTGILCSFYISTAIYAIMANVLLNGAVEVELSDWYVYGSAIAVGLIGLLAFLILHIGKCGGQWHIYNFLNILTVIIVGCASGAWSGTICLFILLVIAKVISREKVLAIQICDVVITSWGCLACLISDSPQSYLLLAGVIISILMIHYWQTAYEILLTITLVLYIASHTPDVLVLPAIVGIFLVAILLYNNVERWRGEGILGFNIVALGGQVICYIRLSSPTYQDEYITYLCMLVFGLATIILTFQKKYQMDFKGKYIVLALFLTYMVFVFRTELPVVNSILLMVIALVCVGIGFAFDKKSVRIYGLILSLVVCGKLVLYDFFDAATIQKTILFFVVGVIALIIAAIYIVLEKKSNT